MGKPVEIPDPSALEAVTGAVKDAFLFAGDYQWMFYAALAAFCACNAGAVLKATPKINCTPAAGSKCGDGRPPCPDC